MAKCSGDTGCPDGGLLMGMLGLITCVGGLQLAPYRSTPWFSGSSLGTFLEFFYFYFETGALMCFKRQYKPNLTWEKAHTLKNQEQETT